MGTKSKTISGPYQTYQIRVSVSTLAELQSMQPPGVDGAPTFFRDNGLPWFWFSQLPAGYTASADGHTGATAGKSGFYVSLFALVAAAALGSFLTVQRASTSRMLDVPSSTLFLVKDGARTYVQSFVSGWHWEANFPAAKATDNVKTCRPTAWIATGLDGAFVRDVQGDQTARDQGAWFINSTATDNEGNGSALDPLQSDDELLRRWGTAGSIPLTVPVAVTYAQTPTVKTSFSVRVVEGGSLTVNGVRTVTNPGQVISAVTTQVRTPGAEARWGITAPNLGAADVGRICIITQSVSPASIGAYARILANNGGGNVTVSPFGVFAVTDITPFTQVTPQVGDVVDVVTMPTLNMGTFQIVSNEQTSTLANPTRNCVVFDSLVLDGTAATFNGIVTTITCPVFYARCIAQFLQFGGGGQIGFHRFCGGGLNRVSIPAGGVLQVRQSGVTGGSAAISVSSGGLLSMLSDVYFQDAQISLALGAMTFSQGAACFARAAADSTIVLQEGGVYRQSGGVPDWGTGNAGHGIKVFSTGNYVYAVKPTVNSGLGAGREALIGGTDKLYTAVPFIEPANNAALVLTA